MVAVDAHKKSGRLNLLPLNFVTAAQIRQANQIERVAGHLTHHVCFGTQSRPDIRKTQKMEG
jgi:hypothetical protein